MESGGSVSEGFNTGITVVGLMAVRGYSWIASFISAFTPLETGTPSVLKGLDSGSRLPLCNLVHDTALMEVCNGLGGMMS